MFLARFTAFLRAVMPGLAGTARMPYRRFLAFNAAGGLIWAVGFTLLGYLAGASYQKVEKIAGRASAALLAILILAAPHRADPPPPAARTRHHTRPPRPPRPAVTHRAPGPSAHTRRQSAHAHLPAGHRHRPAARGHRTVPGLQPRPLGARAGPHRRRLAAPGHRIGLLHQPDQPVPGVHRRPARGHRGRAADLLPTRLGPDHPRLPAHPAAQLQRAADRHQRRRRTPGLAADHRHHPGRPHRGAVRTHLPHPVRQTRRRRDLPHHQRADPARRRTPAPRRAHRRRPDHRVAPQPPLPPARAPPSRSAPAAWPPCTTAKQA